MLAQVKLIRVFVASPGDVVDERESLVGVIAELNRTIAREKDARIELVRWETDAIPGFGVDAQDVINRQIEPTEIFIGIFRCRLGTPTRRAESGTVEEFEQAYASFKETGLPHILLYFREVPAPAGEGCDDQKERLEAFRTRVEQQGAFYRRYADPSAFVPMVREHLANEIQDVLEASETAPASSLVTAQSSVIASDDDEPMTELFSTCRNLVRVADDLNTYSDHYLATQPETAAALARQVADLTDAIGLYNDAWNRLYRQRADFEATVRALNRKHLDEVHDLASTLLTRALDFPRGYEAPDEVIASEFRRHFKRLDTRWRENRIVLGSSLAKAREAIDLFEEYLEKLARQHGDTEPKPSPKSAWAAIGLLADYRDQAAGFGTSIEAFVAANFDVPAEVVKAAWAMAPWIESMNRAYAALEERSISLRISLLRSGPSASPYDRLAGLIRRAEDFQWHEVRPLLNALLATVIAVVQGDLERETLEQLRRQGSKWRELVQILAHGSKLFDLSDSFPTSSSR